MQVRRMYALHIRYLFYHMQIACASISYYFGDE